MRWISRCVGVDFQGELEGRGVGVNGGWMGGREIERRDKTKVIYKEKEGNRKRQR